jgi:hypothetical protein
MVNKVDGEFGGNALLEKEIEEKLRRSVKKAGGRAYKFLSPGNAGVPDRLIVLPGGQVVFVELKRRGRKPEPLQRIQIERLRKLGCEVRIVTGMEGLGAFLAEFGL